MQFVRLAAALAPVAWGTSYAVVSEAMPADRPLFAAAVRALPAGLALLALSRRLPQGIWWLRAAVLGLLNMGIFFALLFVAAVRLPGGVLGTLGAVTPLLAAGLAFLLAGERPGLRVFAAGVAGLAGVALVVLQARAALDPVGVGAGLGAAVSLALGMVLTRRWGRPESVTAFAAWQLVAGGAFLLVLMLAFEGVPTTLTGTHLGAIAYLSVVATAVAYVVWFRALDRLPVSTVSPLLLLSPVVATLVGWGLLGETLVPLQGVGVVLVLGSVLFSQTAGRQEARETPRVPARAVSRNAPMNGPRHQPERLACGCVPGACYLTGQAR